MAVEAIDHIGEGLDGIVVARVLDLRPHPNADKIQLVDVDAGDGEALQICCGAFNMAVGDLVPARHARHRRCRAAWRSSGASSAASGPTACSARPRARPRRRPRRHPDPRPARRSALGTPIAEALGIAARRALRPRDQPQPARRHVGGRRGPRPRRPARPAVRHARARRSRPAPATPRRACRSRSSTPTCAAASSPGCIDGVTRRAVAATGSPTGSRALGMRPINNVVDVSNYVMLELGQPNHTYDLAKVAGGALRVRWARDGETHRDPRRRRAHAHRRRDGVIADGDDAAVGIAGVMGGASTEISDTTTVGAARDGLVGPDGDRRQLEAPRPAQRGVGPLRAGRRPRDRRPRRPPLRRAAGARRAPDWSTGAVDRRRRPARPRAGAGAHRPGQRPARHRPRRPTTIADAARAHRLRRRGRRDEPGTCSVTVPTFRPDTTTETDVIEEVARHHGYSRIPQRGADGGAHRRRSRRASATGARSARSWSGSASTRPCRCRSSRPATSAAAGLPGDGRHAHQPAGRRGVGAAHLAAARPAQGRRLQRVAPHRRRRACSRSARSSASRRRRSSCPTSASTSAWCWPVREAAGRGRGLAGAGRHARAADGAGIDQVAPSPACTPAASGVLVRRRRRSSARSARSIPACSTRLGIGERVAWLEVDLDRLLGAAPRRAARTARSAATRRATSTSPSRSTRPSPAGRVERRHPGRGGRAARRPAPVRRVPRRRRCPTAGAASPTACGSRPPTAPSPTTTSPRCATPSSPRSRASLGATLRA